MALSEFLDYFELDYAIKDGSFVIIDLVSSYINDIEREAFETITDIVDRLDIYYHDYIYKSVCELGYDGVEYYQDILEWLKKEYPDGYLLPCVKCIINPELITLD